MRLLREDLESITADDIEGIWDCKLKTINYEGKPLKVIMHDGHPYDINELIKSLRRSYASYYSGEESSMTDKEVLNWAKEIQNDKRRVVEIAFFVIDPIDLLEVNGHKYEVKEELFKIPNYLGGSWTAVELEEWMLSNKKYALLRNYEKYDKPDYLNFSDTLKEVLDYAKGLISDITKTYKIWKHNDKKVELLMQYSTALNNIKRLEKRE